MPELPKKLQQKIEERKNENALRSLPKSADLIDFTSNDYLGFSKNEHIFKATAQLLQKQAVFKNGATGSRLLSGNHFLYRELEKKLAVCHKAEAALVFNSGYDANQGFFSSVPQRGDIVFYDELIHASIRDGIKMGDAKSYKFKHNDLHDLRSRLERTLSTEGQGLNNINERSRIEVYIVTESVFSMNGDSPNLIAFAEYCSINRYHLIIDEAHALGIFGVNGLGLVQELGLEQKVFARIFTFGKAIGCHGAAILGSTDLKNYLVNFARSFIYTTGLPPHSIATVLSAYEFLNSSLGREERQKLKKNIDYFKLECETLTLKPFFILSDSAVHCCIIEGNSKARSIAKKIQKTGFDCRPILSPTVEKGKERLRFCLHSYNTKEEISRILRTVKENITKLQLPSEKDLGEGK
jgi:8-amino-7-oxononanoate synthase